MARTTSGKDSGRSTAKPAPKLLSGGNPQIPKSFGEAPVRAYLDAVPGWKQEICRRLDALIVAAVPQVRKAVKWNTPLYGSPQEEGTWFTGIHCFTSFVRVTFFRGAELDPLPPGPSRVKDTRYLDLPEGAFDEAQLSAWVKQASALPGERM